MANRSEKKRLCVWIPVNTYHEVHDFVQNKELVTSKLSPGSLITIGVNLFFKELEKRPLEDIVGEYLINGRPGVED